jgi:hypothetical protein
LPFDLLNKSRKIHVEFLSEVDSLREAFINTLIVSGYVDSPDPVAVTMNDVREFLSDLNLEGTADVIPDHLENVLLDLIQELGEDLDEEEAELLTKEVIRTAQKLLDVVVHEKDTVTSSSEAVFFKRWSRLLFLSEGPDPLKRILSGEGMLDEFEFETLLDRLLIFSEAEASQVIERLPWRRMAPNQIVRLFHHAQTYQGLIAKSVSLEAFTALDLVDLLEELDPDVVKNLLRSLQKALAKASFTLEDLELLAGLPDPEASVLLRMANPPADLELTQILVEFRDATERMRQVLFASCMGSEIFPELLAEAWSIDPDFVKRQLKALPPAQIGPFFDSATPNRRPKVVTSKSKDPELDFGSKMLNSLFKSLSKGKKGAAVKFFNKG